MSAKEDGISRRSFFARSGKSAAGLAAFSALASCAAEKKDGFKAQLAVGLAQVDYTPAVGLDLVGNYRGDDYASRGVHDLLYAKALVAANAAGQKVALLAVDICKLDGECVTMMRQFIASKCDIAAENILIHATHSGPESALEAPKAGNFLQKAAGAILLANENLMPAKLAVGYSSEDRLSNNRALRCKDGSMHMNWEKLDPGFVIGPRGPIDPQVITVSIEQQGGAKAALVNFGNHPAILAGDNWLYSADYPGYLAEAMSKIHGDKFLTLYCNGCAGNVNHIDYTDNTQGRGYQMTQRNGYMLAAAASAAMNSRVTAAGDQVIASRDMVPLQRFPITTEQLEWSRRIIEKAEREGSAAAQVDGIPDEWYARRWVQMHETQEEVDRVEVMALRIGEIGVVGLPGEIFCEIGMEIKKRSPAKHTIVIGLANDSRKYFPTREAFNEGPEGFRPGLHGYETTPGTTDYAVGSAEKLTESALRQLSDLFKV